MSETKRRPKTANLFPVTSAAVSRRSKEERFHQCGKVLWFYGLSGSGKSTLATRLEHELHQRDFHTALLDGDNVRTGLNSDLGFSDAERTENIRRVAEVAKLFCDAGIVTLVACITPKKSMRAQARAIIGSSFIEIFVDCPFETCAQRDVKGLYAKASQGGLKDFTGKDSGFEPGEAPELVVSTNEASVESSMTQLQSFILPQISPRKPV